MSEEQSKTRWLEKQAHMLEYARPVKSVFDAIPITPEEAKKIVDEFEHLFPLVAEWHENLKAERKERLVKKPASVQAPPACHPGSSGRGL